MKLKLEYYCYISRILVACLERLIQVYNANQYLFFHGQKLFRYLVM